MADAELIERARRFWQDGEHVPTPLAMADQATNQSEVLSRDEGER